jgi:hypothetical protein
MFTKFNQKKLEYGLKIKGLTGLSEFYQLDDNFGTS